MPDDISVVFASNRGPVAFVATDDGFGTRDAAGGASPALHAVAKRLKDRAEWIAAAVSDADRAAIAAGAGDELSQRLGYDLYFLDIDPEMYHRYYNVVSNRMLWFANHCLWDEIDVPGFGAREVAAWEDAYEPVNKRFAEAIAETADLDALVLFQDYHLATAPAHLRSLRPQQPIMHFTHSSFCGPEGLDHLPAPIPRAVIHGMLSADLVGFHVPPWAEGFFACCEAAGARVDRDRGAVEHEGRTTWVRTYPIPVDPHGLRQRARGPKATEWAERCRSWAGDGALIVRADRAEPSKNIVRGFQAFAALLDRRPDLASKVRFAACLYPSRQDVPEYQDYTRQIEEAVADVERKHPGSVEMFMKDDFDRTLGAYREYDILLVNSIMDGMNLVSKEGPALNERSGALVLSRGAGSYTELGEVAIEIPDAHDVEQTSRALEEALELSAAERKTRADRLRAIVESTTPDDWIDRQIADLAALRDNGAPLTDPPRLGNKRA
ncbi:MAG TPA: trehalose-6-phosphate synthase [Vicinamibacterales bacterium]|nr:trehalose-6-phosphate synthase [Vicinamibacterales bacterium]